MDNSPRNTQSKEVSLGQDASRAGESLSEIKDERLGASLHAGRSTNIVIAQKKTEKLTMALYMVTDVLPDREPLKWQLREGATKLLSEVALTATAGASDKFYLWGRAETRIDEICALLDIAGITKMMSEMNASVLKKEYLGLKYQIAVERESIGGHGGVTLSDSFFAEPEAPAQHQLMSGMSSIGAVAIESNILPRVPEAAPVATPVPPSASIGAGVFPALPSESNATKGEAYTVSSPTLVVTPIITKDTEVNVLNTTPVTVSAVRVEQAVPDSVLAQSQIPESQGNNSRETFSHDVASGPEVAITPRDREVVVAATEAHEGADTEGEVSDIEPVVETRGAVVSYTEVQRDAVRSSDLSSRETSIMAPTQSPERDEVRREFIPRTENVRNDTTVQPQEKPRTPEARPALEPSLKDLPVVARPLASVIRPHHVAPEPKPAFSATHDSHEGRLPSSSRRQVILEVLHQKPDLSVRDLVDKIEGFSEKTIQRELLSMVSDGLLRKQGERRWSRYSLAR